MFHSTKDILNSQKFQNEAPAKVKHIVRKVNREAERKNLRKDQKDNRKKDAA